MSSSEGSPKRRSSTCEAAPREVPVHPYDHPWSCVVTETIDRPEAASHPDILWNPAADGSSGLERFARWVTEHRGHDFVDYDALHAWSTAAPQQFWADVADYFAVDFHSPAAQVLTDTTMPGAQWFPGATVNYAEHALRVDVGKADADTAIVYEREDGLCQEVPYGRLRADVAALVALLRKSGVRRGDRVAGVVANSTHAIVAFLATAALGAIWTAASPDFGEQAIVDRFSQTEPTVLIAVDGYRYNGKIFDTTPTIRKALAAVPSISTTVVIDYVGDRELEDDWLDWQTELDNHRGSELSFEAVPFEHPLWVLYSSGTTGLPKGIVHGHGGILLEHLKTLSLQMDLDSRDRFLWFTTTGWMMWNLLVSGLLVGTPVVLYDGNPGYPDIDRLWRLAAEHRVTYFGTSAPFIQACHKNGLNPGADHDLSAIRAIGSTGSPLTSDGFRWIGENVSADAQICSVSGGTDVCTAFLGTAPTVPVWRGELSCRALGADIHAFDDNGHEIDGGIGELVITTPMPSMPVFFWDDADGTSLRDAYYDTFPGVWRHGDSITISDRGSVVIHGRSDATLNRGGVRMGTAEFYRVLESLDAVRDSLIVDTTALANDGGEGELVCFVVLAEGHELGHVEKAVRTLIRTQLSPRHVPDRIIAAPDVPRTLNGKKCEIPVKKILAGTPVARAINSDALANPDALDFYAGLAE
ncbi:acetoacetate--CoA ligase [Gordonia sp. zg691]|nr:acetoacetate--CoA ligase [Gordonia jinghuaiqii]